MLNLRRLSAPLMLLLAILFGSVAPTASASQKTGDLLYQPLPITLKQIGPLMSGGESLEAIGVSGDWAAYVQNLQPCGHCSLTAVKIHLDNVVDGRNITVTPSWLDNQDTIIAGGNIQFAAPYLVWTQPLAPPDSEKAFKHFIPGDADCAVCVYDLRSGKISPVADLAGLQTSLNAQAQPRAIDPSGSGRLLVQLHFTVSSTLYLADLAAGTSKSLPVAWPTGQNLTSAAVGKSFAAWVLQPSEGRYQLFHYSDASGAVLNKLDQPDVLWVTSNGDAMAYTSQNRLYLEDPTTLELSSLQLSVYHSNPIIVGAKAAWLEYPGQADNPRRIYVEDISTFQRSVEYVAAQDSRQSVEFGGFSGDKLLWLTTDLSTNGPPSAQRIQFAWLATPDPAYGRVWAQADQPVAAGHLARSWLWGPTPRFIGYEAYAEGKDGQHLVYYYDKSRMEINNPDGDPNDPHYVTNGLLVVEMMSGEIQVGDTKFERSREPARLTVAGDPRKDNPLTPDYATFAKVASLHGENQAPERRGQPVADTIDVNGVVGEDSVHAALAGGYVAFTPQTGHNIPAVFYTYLDAMRNEYDLDWTAVLGYPITEAYWTTMRVSGKDYPVLIQAYQRRVLTFTPDFEAPWQIQQGNVGSHYLQWRYTTSN